MNHLERMGNSEAEIMKILWKHKGKPITASEIQRKVEETSQWTRSTILTLIRRLVEKGFVSCKKEDVFYYTPLVSEDEYRNFQTRTFIDRIYNGSVKNLVSTLCRADSLSKEDIQELRKLLDREADENV